MNDVHSNSRIVQRLAALFHHDIQTLQLKIALLKAERLKYELQLERLRNWREPLGTMPVTPEEQPLPVQTPQASPIQNDPPHYSDEESLELLNYPGTLPWKTTNHTHEELKPH